MLIFLNILYGIAFICWMCMAILTVTATKTGKEYFGYLIGMWLSNLAMIIVVCINLSIEL